MGFRLKTIVLVVLWCSHALSAAAETPTQPKFSLDLQPSKKRAIQAQPVSHPIPPPVPKPVVEETPLPSVSSRKPVSPLPAAVPPPQLETLPSNEGALLAPIPDPATCLPPGNMHNTQEELSPTPTELRLGSMFARARTSHQHPDDPQRHFGIGEPLFGTSWRNRPFYFNPFVGGLLGDDLQAGEVEQGSGVILGARLGADVDHFWGLESRLAFSELQVNYPAFSGSGKSSVSLFDASVLYYPLGDTRWRPYFTAGFGVAGFRYTDDSLEKIRAGAIEMPFGGGVKYLIARHTAIRFDLIDNFTLPSGGKLDSMHNLSFTGGVEIRFGGRSTSYGSW